MFFVLIHIIDNVHNYINEVIKEWDTDTDGCIT